MVSGQFLFQSKGDIMSKNLTAFQQSKDIGKTSKTMSVVQVSQLSGCPNPFKNSYTVYLPLATSTSSA